MKKIVILLLIAVVSVAVAEVATKSSLVDTLIGRITGDYEKAVNAADARYKKSAAPLLKRYGKFRDKSIVLAGDKAIKRLTLAGKGVSELDGIKMEKEIEKIRASIDERVGASPAADTHELKWDLISLGQRVNRFKYKEHTYLAFTGKMSCEEAKAACKKMGGHLVDIETQGELAFLAKTFKGGWWTGAHKTSEAAGWKWSNGRPVDKRLLGGGKGPYANLQIRPDKTALSTKHGWSGRSLGCITGFICEWE